MGWWALGRAVGSESRRTDMRAAGPEGRDEGSADRGFDGWRLKTATPILSKFVDENKIRVEIGSWPPFFGFDLRPEAEQS